MNGTIARDGRPTEKQDKFIATLLDEAAAVAAQTGNERDVENIKEMREGLRTRWVRRDLAPSQATDAISTLIDVKRSLQRVVQANAQTFPTILDGHYALVGTEGAANEIVFYDVWTSSKGRRMVSLNISDDRQVMPRPQADAILARIAEDPRAAGMLYATKTVRCYLCGRQLTDDESRDRGVGPVCANKL